MVDKQETGLQTEIVNYLKKYSKCHDVKLVNRGNTAILLAFLVAKKKTGGKYVIIQDQGGWLDYEKLAKKAGLEVYRVKTKNGVVDVPELDIAFKELKFKDVACFIINQPSGYCLNQVHLPEIIVRMTDYYSLEGSKALLVLDASGSIGSKLCDGSMVDFVIGSFREWKPVDVGYGGFISWSEQSYNSLIEESFNELMTKQNVSFDVSYYPKLIEKLKNVKQRYELLHKECDKIVFDLKEKFELLYDSGLVVIVKYKNADEKNKIIEYCKVNCHEFTECPREIRVLDNAISIEVKRK